MTTSQTVDRSTITETRLEKRSFIQRHRRLLMVGGPLVFAIAGFLVWLSGGRYATTDDAYIQAGRVAVSTNVAGRVSEVDVHDNEAVKKGQTLFKLDDRPFKIAVDDAAAKLAGEKLQVAALEATYQQRMADLKGAQDTLAYEQTEFARQKKLAKSGISSAAQLDQASHAVDAASQQVLAAQQVIASVLAQLGGNPELPVEQHPSVEEAQAALDRANLNLSYATITAPIDGVVTKVEQLQTGDYINAAAPVFSLVSSTNVYVEGNFKETQLTYMKPGQHATFKIDAFGSRIFNGTVASTSPGTGSSFSLLPPENASGNWVKVVQRVPVRIAIAPADLASIPLSPGMSVNLSIDTQHHRTLFGG